MNLRGYLHLGECYSIIPKQTKSSRLFLGGLPKRTKRSRLSVSGLLCVFVCLVVSPDDFFMHVVQEDSFL